MESLEWMKSRGLGSVKHLERQVYFQQNIGMGYWLIKQDLDTGLSTPIIKVDSASIGYGGRSWDISACGLKVVHCDKQGQVFLSFLDERKTIKIAEGFEGVGCPSFSPNGQTVYFSAEKEGCCDVFEFNGNEVIAITQESWYAWNPQACNGVVAWMQWGEQRMSWEESCIGYRDDSKDYKIEVKNCSLSQPRFSKDGRFLLYLSDETGSRQIWVYDLSSKKSVQLTSIDGEIGRPEWIVGNQFWDIDDNDIVFMIVESGIEKIGLIRSWQESQEVEFFTAMDLTAIDSVSIQNGLICVAGNHNTHPGKLMTFDYHQQVWTQIATSQLGLMSPVISDLQSEVQVFRQGREEFDCVLRWAHKGKAPLLVHIHGGPTSHESLSWRPDALFWNTQGWHWMSVNHRGSTGRGREFQDALKHNWGIVDVEDTCYAVEQLVKEGRVDPEQVVIYGGSSGG